MPLISARLPAAVRAALRPLLTNTYTRTGPPVAVTDEDGPVLDAWGNPTYTDGTATSGLPCMYLSTRRMVVREQGNVILDVPTLYVYHDDTLTTGDTVTNITDRDGTVLVASAVVDDIDPAAEAGASVMKVCTLSSVVAVA